MNHETTTLHTDLPNNIVVNTTLTPTGPRSLVYRQGDAATRIKSEWFINHHSDTSIVEAHNNAIKVAPRYVARQEARASLLENYRKK